MKQIIWKSEFKIKKLPNRIAIDEKEIIDEKIIVKKINHFYVNIGPKLGSKIAVSSTNFEQYVKHKGPNFNRKEHCDEELNDDAFISVKSKKSAGYDGVSSNVIKSVSAEIFGLLKHVLNLSVNQGVFYYYYYYYYY